MFSDPSLAEVWRTANAVLCVLAIAGLLRAAYTRWGAWSPSLRLSIQAIIALLLYGLTGSLEQVFLRPAPVGLRTGVLTISCFWLIWALATGAHDDYEGAQHER